MVVDPKNESEKSGLLHCRQILYQLSYQRSLDPKNIRCQMNVNTENGCILEAWVMVLPSLSNWSPWHFHLSHQN